jgi:hypothetical protein
MASLRRASEKGGEAEFLLDSDDPMYQALEDDVRFELQTERLVEKYRKASGKDEKEVVEEEIAETVQEHFEARQELRELEVERLETQLEKIREQISRRADLAEAIIQRRVDQLTGRTSDLDWDVNGGAKASRRSGRQPVFFNVPVPDVRHVAPIAPPLPPDEPAAPHVEVHGFDVEVDFE